MPALRRQLGRCPAALQGKMLAPRNGGTRLCRQWGANLADGQRRLRAKCWRLVTEIHGFAGNGAPTRALGPARTWCTSPRKTLFFRFLCTKSSSLFSARPAMGRQLVRLPTTGRRLESRKGEWPRPFSFSSFPQSKASGGTPEAHELLFLCSISIQSISIS